jgi:hypothetical protein
MIAFDPDQLGSASYRNLIANTSGPLRAGATETLVPLDATATATIAWTAREPLALVLARTAVAQDVVLEAALADHTSATFGSLLFAAYSESGTPLPAHRPTVDTGTHLAQPFALTLVGKLLKKDGTLDRNLSAAEVAAGFEVRIIEGNFGRLLYALSAEKARVRREAARLTAMRSVRYAEREALDRIGREIGVPRFTNTLSYDPATKQIVAGFGSLGAPVMEGDDDYRRRLALYRPFSQSTPQRVRNVLNGPGNATDPNAGLLAGMGLTKRFTIAESDEALAMTLQLVETGPAAFRANFLTYARQNFLIWLEDTPAATTAHGARFLPLAQQAAITASRTRLRTAFTFPAGATVSPAVASALDRYAALRTLLGGTGKVAILRAQDNAGGSRYELGLGVALASPAPSELNALAARVTDATRTRGSADQEALLASVKPVNAAGDAEGAWLLNACGFQTVHRVDSGTIYVSPLPIYGLVIGGPSAAAAGTDTALNALYQAPGDPGGNAALLAGIATAAARWTAAGNAAWTALSDSDAHAAWQGAPSRATADGALAIFRAAGLVAVEQPSTIVPQLLALPVELMTTIRLDAALSAGILAEHSDAGGALAVLVGMLRDAGLSSVIPLVDAANEVVLIVAVTGLPLAGLNLNDRRASGFRWYVVPICGAAGAIRGTGSATVYHSNGPGLVAIVTIGYARQGRMDPYEYGVDLPDGAVLTLAQYEFVMNLLAANYPTGVMINTFAIRSKHVDLDGDGVADPLLPAQARTYREFRRARYRGEAAIGLDSTDTGLGT